MRVALNLVFLVPGQTGGMEAYARELVSRLAAIGGIELTCLVGRPAAGQGPWSELAREVVLPVDATSRAEWVMGEQWYVPRAAQRAGADIVHSLASTAPLHGRQVRVTTIHDLNFMMVPEAHFGLRGAGMRVLVPAAAKRSNRLIADSNSTRDDLVSRLGVSPGKVDVVPLAAQVTGMSDPALRNSLSRRLDLDDRWVLIAPGAKRPHKNASLVIDALASMDTTERPKLVVTGYRTPYESEIRSQVDSLGLANDVVIADNLSAREMEALYELADCVVVPSRYEGFGLPVLEGMTRGLPVIASDRSSLPEVAGGAALLVDPESVEEMARAIRQLMGNPAVVERLSAAGIERARDFTWERTALLTRASYERALGSLE